MEAIIDIHPYDVAEMLMSSDKEIVLESEPDPTTPGSNLTRINGTLYRQTTAVPQKGNTIR